MKLDLKIAVALALSSSVLTLAAPTPEPGVSEVVSKTGRKFASLRSSLSFGKKAEEDYSKVLSPEEIEHINFLTEESLRQKKTVYSATRSTTPPDENLAHEGAIVPYERSSSRGVRSASRAHDFDSDSVGSVGPERHISSRAGYDGSVSTRYGGRAPAQHGSYGQQDAAGTSFRPAPPAGSGYEQSRYGAAPNHYGTAPAPAGRYPTPPQSVHAQEPDMYTFGPGVQEARSSYRNSLPSSAYPGASAFGGEHGYGGGAQVSRPYHDTYANPAYQGAPGGYPNPYGHGYGGQYGGQHGGYGGYPAPYGQHYPPHQASSSSGWTQHMEGPAGERIPHDDPNYPPLAPNQNPVGFLWGGGL